MNYKPILLIAGEPNSIFLEIFFKKNKIKKFKSPLILIASYELLKLQMKKIKIKKNIRILNSKNINKYQLNNKVINLIDVNYETKKAFEKISSKSNEYIENSFEIALKLIKNKISNKLINGPVSKKFFLKKKFLGITEYLAKKTKSKDVAMLIYNPNLSVSPVTTHLPLKLVSKKINKKIIIKKIILINDFYKKKFKKKPIIAITGLNPHCESVHKFNEDLKILKPVVSKLKKSKYKVNGPFSADTIFLKKNRKNYY